ncbi:DUF5074 domain-containing protein [uncultured Rikenella sp.]|mgnify:CR=1 FL=1|uniref:YncE family protein n=1 Tax=uncultured Rikenella sp. TaxID=368003 RepID=UPI0025FFE695|nr:DUF5074 domain-containing protein [uncultured Rikenella sp.]
MKRTIGYIIGLVAAASLTGGCMEWDYGPEEEVALPEGGVFILNEGNFQYGNASLSYYDPNARTASNELFFRANGMKLGDVAQSMVVRKGVGWIVVNNSHVVFAIDTRTCREIGRITGFTSPRYIHFLGDEKAYVSQLWDNRIFIVNPRKFEITGYIECPGMTMETGSTEQMVQDGRYVYVNCWSYQNRILKIDTETDEVVDELEVGIQPTSLVLDCHRKLWTITDGGTAGSPYGYEAPALCRIDPEGFRIERRFGFRTGDRGSEVQLNGTRDTLYWINGDVWRMPVTAEGLPERPFLEDGGTIYYGLTVDPVRSDVYIADAIDYQQPGMICRYSAGGELIDRFYVGITPGAFGWATNGKGGGR